MGIILNTKQPIAVGAKNISPEKQSKHKHNINTPDRGRGEKYFARKNNQGKNTTSIHPITVGAKNISPEKTIKAKTQHQYTRSR
jgi:hypothetical protein